VVAETESIDGVKIAEKGEASMVNRVILVGRLTRDPELVTTPKGTTLAKLRLATNTYGKDDDGNRAEDVQYHSLVAFGRLAEICQEYLSRGRLIYAEGKLRSREWDGKDGLRRYTTEVTLDNMQMLGPKPESGAEAEASVPTEPVGAGA
jgi:single-strand DNA-binding protein